MFKKGLKIALASLVILSVGLAGCGNTTPAPDASKQEAKTENAKVLRVGTNPTFAPFEFVDEKGKITGFDMEVIEAVAEDMGYKVEYVNSSFDGLIPAIQAGNFDAIASAMTINAKREESVDFADRYFLAEQFIAVKKDSPIKSEEDLKGKKIGVQMATTGQDVVEGMGIDPKKYEAIPDAMNDLLNGTIDAVVADSPVVLYFIKQNPNFNVQYIKGDFPKEYYGIAVKEGNKELKDKINASLKKIQDNKKYNEIYKKWFNVDAPSLS